MSETQKQTVHNGERDVEFVTLPNETAPSDVEEGVEYAAKVHNIVDYGVFVTLSQSYRNYPEVTGLVHKSNLPPLFTPRDFTEGDRVVVSPVNIENDGGRIDLAMVDYIEIAKDDRFGPQPTNDARAREATADGAREPGGPSDDGSPSGSAEARERPVSGAESKAGEWGLAKRVLKALLSDGRDVETVTREDELTTDRVTVTLVFGPEPDPDGPQD